MSTIQIEDNQVQHVWDLCSAAYLRHGSRLSMPANTDPTKTYQWRYAKAITAKFNEWDFDNDTSAKFIDIAAKRAKERGLLHKGLSILHQNDMLQICFQALQQEERGNKGNVVLLRDTKNWVDSQINGRDPISVLLARTSNRALCNLSIWYKASKLSNLYLSLSQSCRTALSRLSQQSPDERGQFPSAPKLYMLRVEFLNDIGNKRHAQQIFNSDWNEICL